MRVDRLQKLGFMAKFRLLFFFTLIIIGVYMLNGCGGSKISIKYSEDNFRLGSISNQSPIHHLNDYVASDISDIDSILNKMSLEEKIGQLFMIRAHGFFHSREDEEFQAISELIRKYHVGGIMFANGHVYAQALITHRLQRLSKIPLWIAQDTEYGLAMRVSGSSWFPPAMAISSTNNPEYAYIVGKITAREAKALGVHQIFSPVLDINNNPNNPIINVRSYSEKPSIVSLYGNAYIRGVLEEGVVPTAKHFPGHGNTSVDSHLKLPILSHSIKQLTKLELRPFASAIKIGIPSIMSAHIAFPKIGNPARVPATMNQRIIGGLLREKLNFDGIVVTDGLEMGGITSHFSPGEAVIQALLAGSDIMLLSPDEPTAIHQVKQAIKKGIISIERIEHSVKKILKWKYEYGLFTNRYPNIENLHQHIGLPQYQEIAQKISRESVTLLKNNHNIIPIRPAKYPNLFVLNIANDKSGTTGTKFIEVIRDYHPNTTFMVYDKRSNSDEETQILNYAKNSDLIILNSFIYVQSHRTIQLHKDQKKFLKTLFSLNKPIVFVSFGNPYIIKDFPEADVHLLAWSSRSTQVRQTVPTLFGGTPIQGKLSTTIPNLYKFDHGIQLKQTAVRFDTPGSIGMDSKVLKEIDTLMQQSVWDSLFPGGTVTIVKDGVIAYNKGFGYHTYKKLQEVKSSDIYDLSSLTKIVGTTTAVMELIDEKKIKLNDKLDSFLPGFSQGNKKEIDIEHLLTHTSGLPSFREYVDSLRNKQSILNAVSKESLIYPPGEKYVYSDLGFILLAQVVEKITKKSIDTYLREKFFYPLGMISTHYNPHTKGRWITQRIPPTEIDHRYDRGEIQTYVHDERAYFMDGVAGHAGLFSSGRDLAVYATMLLQKGTYAGQRYISSKTIGMFSKPRWKKSIRGLGFDRKSPNFSSAGKLTSEYTYGHLGFTGTSIWIDPKTNIAIIILTNRTYPSRDNRKSLQKLRASVADIAIKSIFEG